MKNKTLTRLAVVPIWLTLMSGCASTPTEQVVDSTDTGLLYDGDAKVLYDAKHKAQTSEEALELGRQALQAGEIDRALYQYVRAYELDPSQYQVLYQVGTIHNLRGNVDRAALAFDLVLKARPDHPEALMERGLLEIGNRRYTQAAGYLEQALASNPQLWRAFNGLGVLADLRRDAPSARAHYEDALRLNPRSAVLLNNFGYSKYLAGDWLGARKDIRAALDVDPGYRRAWLNLGLIHARQGEYDQALAAFGNIIDRAQACERVGSLALIEGKYEVAEKYLNLAIDLSPTYYKDAFDKLEELQTLRVNGQYPDRAPSPTDRIGALAPGLEPVRMELYKPSGIRTKSRSQSKSDHEFTRYLQQLSRTDQEVSLRLSLGPDQALAE